jgi:hypothetical protein
VQSSLWTQEKEAEAAIGGRPVGARHKTDTAKGNSAFLAKLVVQPAP